MKASIAMEPGTSPLAPVIEVAARSGEWTDWRQIKVDADESREPQSRRFGPQAWRPNPHESRVLVGMARV